MARTVDVFYNGWGEYWRWGTLVSTTALTGRPLIAFEFSDEARSRGLELSAYRLPLNGARLRHDFPAHQDHLPGPVYDAMPDGWGRLLMDRLFRRRGLNPARIGPLDRLAYVASSAMGAMSFEPRASSEQEVDNGVPLSQLAAEVEQVLIGEGGAFLQRLFEMGGSPQGARPKVLLYRQPDTGRFSTGPEEGSQAWLIKFPAAGEHPEVCAIEAVYAQALRRCGIAAPETAYFSLERGYAAFASMRFDRVAGHRVPMQSLATFTGADYRIPGALDYTAFLRATYLCTNDVRQKLIAFERAVFNVVFHNRDDHPKNFSYVMEAAGQWTLAPAYDVTFCEGPQGYHQMDVMGEALTVSRRALVALGVQEADISAQAAGEIIDRIGDVATGFMALARDLTGDAIRSATLRHIQAQLDENVRQLA